MRRIWLLLIFLKMPLWSYEPWHTDTLLTFTAETTPPGHLLFQAYLYERVEYGFYQNNGKNFDISNIYVTTPSLEFEFGLTEWMDVTAVASLIYSAQNNKSFTSFGQTFLGLGFQLTRSSWGALWPNLRLMLFENFPTGRYQKLNPAYTLAEANLTGAYYTGSILVLEKTLGKETNFPFSINNNFIIQFGTPIHVKGANFYGGNNDTKGTIHPGYIFVYNLALELSLTQKWVICTDINYAYTAASSFSGNLGGPRPLNLARYWALSMTPGIEYNFTKDIGVLATFWPTLAGANTPAYLGFALSFVATF